MSLLDTDMHRETHYRYSVARVEVVDKKVVSRCTGFLVAEDLVLTALHGVADWDDQDKVVIFKAGEIRLTFEDHVTTAKPFEQFWDANADWILLRCDAVPDSSSYIPLSDLDRDQVDWRTFGYPEGATRNGLFQSGVVESYNAPLNGASVLQLYSKQAAARIRVKGWSGSPVMVRNVAVGHLRSAFSEGETEGGTLYGCRAVDVYERCRKKVAYKPSPYDQQISPDRAIPELLPFLGDRALQVAAVDSLIKQARTAKRPVVAIVHGDGDQSHDMFMCQLKDVEVARTLGLKSDDVRVDLVHVRWPAIAPSVRGPRERFAERYQRELGRALLGHALADSHAIAARLGQTPWPTILHTHVTPEMIGVCGPNWIRDFAQFWHEWPDLPDEQIVLIFVCLVYPAHTGLLAGLRQAVSTRKLRKQLHAADVSNMNVAFDVLPELESVSQPEVEDWAREPMTERCCPFVRLRPEIEKLFRRWKYRYGKSKIPMDALAHELREMLDRVTALEER
jgi:Trypsin-like peptidase domain